jgi:hypothetical protein
MIHIRNCILALLVMVGPAFAADWEGLYEGTLGKAKIRALLLEEETGAYSYSQNAFDLGLHYDSTGPDVSFIESKVPQLLLDDIKGERSSDISGTWQLRFDGQQASGIWNAPKGAKKKVKSAKIALKRVKSLSDIGEGYAAFDAYHALWGQGLTFENPVTGEIMNGVTVGMAADAVFKSKFPRYLLHPDAPKRDAINAMLTEEHRTAAINQRSCVQGARRFLDGENSGELDVQVEFKVTYASPTVISFVESGSAFCGGAHGNNYSVSHTFDLVSMDRLGAKRFDADLEAGQFGRVFDFDTAEKVKSFNAFLNTSWNAAAAKPGPDDEPSCATEEPPLGATLALHFTKNGLAVTKTGYPHVMSVCLWQSYNPTVIPWADLKPYVKVGQALIPELNN